MALKIGEKTCPIPLLRRITAAKVTMAKNCPCSRLVPGKLGLFPYRRLEPKVKTAQGELTVNVSGADSGSKATPQAPTGLGPSGYDPGDISFGKIWRAMAERANLRAKWLHTLPQGHPMLVLANLQNTAACFMSRQAQSDRIDMLKAIADAKLIEDEAFAQWREAIAMETQSAETLGSVGEADDSAAIAQTQSEN